jgi:hypothetical protein
MKYLALSLMLGGLGACQVNTKLVEPVTVVATRTPGVSFVVVRPWADQAHAGATRMQPGDGSKVNASSWYVLLCDARPADGMHCAVPTEAALARYSYTPNVGTATAPIDQGVGTLADFSTHVSRDKDAEEDPAVTPAAAAPAAAAVAPASVAPLAPSPPATSTGKGGKP